jgi:hypothetical protein
MAAPRPRVRTSTSQRHTVTPSKKKNQEGRKRGAHGAARDPKKTLFFHFFEKQKKEKKRKYRKEKKRKEKNGVFYISPKPTHDPKK